MFDRIRGEYNNKNRIAACLCSEGGSILKKRCIWRKFKEWRRKHKLLQTAVLCWFIVLLFVFSLPENQVRSFARNYAFDLVTKNQEALLRLTDKYAQNDKTICRYWFVEDTIPYKRLGDKNLSRVFRQFHLRYIIYTANENTIFWFEPYLSILIKNYSNGFYYSEKNQPMGRMCEEWEKCWEEYNLKCKNNSGYKKYDLKENCYLEYEYEDEFDYHWFRTEKIVGNWWYFEQILYMK